MVNRNFSCAWGKFPLTEQVEREPSTDEIEAQLIFDTKRDRYQLNYVGGQDFKH